MIIFVPQISLFLRLKQLYTTHPHKSLLFDVTLYCPLQLKQLSLMDSLISFINISKENLHFLKTSSFAPSLHSVFSEVLSSSPSGQDDYCGALKCNCVSFVDTYSSCHCLSVWLSFCVKSIFCCSYLCSYSPCTRIVGLRGRRRPRRTCSMFNERPSPPFLCYNEPKGTTL